MTTEKAPQLPTQVSPDGREVWDWAGKLSAYTQRLHKMRLLRADIARTGTRCGDCEKWMKSRLCPKEHNVNGYTRGPSCEGRICGQFQETTSATSRRVTLTAQLVELTGEDT